MLCEKVFDNVFDAMNFLMRLEQILYAKDLQRQQAIRDAKGRAIFDLDFPLSGYFNDASKDACNEPNNASYGVNDASKVVNDASIEYNIVSKDASEVVSDASTEYNIASKDASNIVRLSKDELYDKIMDVCVDYISLDDIAKAVNKTLRYLKSKVIPRMVEQGLLERKYPDTPRHPKQQYRKK